MDIDTEERYYIASERGAKSPQHRILKSKSAETGSGFSEEELIKRIVTQVRLVLANASPDGCDLIVKVYTQ